MDHAYVNIVAPIALHQVAILRKEIGERFGNPAGAEAKEAFRTMEGEQGIHFASFHALLGSDAKRGYLYLEFSADGDTDSAITRLAKAGSALLEPIFSEALDWREGNDLTDYMIRHSVTNGFGYFDNAGVNHCGAPGLSVGRIRREADLRRYVETLIASEPVSKRPMEQLRSVRAKLLESRDWDWALHPPEPGNQENTKLIEGLPRLARAVAAFVMTYLWPFAFPIIGWMLFAASKASGWKAMLKAAVCVGLKGAAISLGIAVAVLLVLYLLLRRDEERAWTSDRVIDRAELAEILKRENFITQNHMISHTVMKPGFVRRCWVKIALFAIGTISPMNGRPGFLGKIGTIHFARWVTLPGTGDYIFTSNFDGSWESYLEDFITKSHEGLTAAWTNCLGFPKTKNLVQFGATDGERFKRFARHSMIHTAFWYSAYPTISTDQIRANSKIRRAIALAESDEEAATMLALFGSAVRPPEKIEANQIQTIVFGGLGNMPHGQCVLINLGQDGVKSKSWLKELKQYVAFSDGRNLPQDWVVSLSFSPHALAKLGLPKHALDTFPAAFLDGMTAPGRERILGDPGPLEREKEWWWGQKTPDLALLIYAHEEKHLINAATKIAALNTKYGAQIVHSIPLKPVESDEQKRTEPFGFVDGISQPLINGTYKATKDPNKLNLVEPGEFILGYPDNRGNLPPIPRMNSRRDPDRILPIGSGGWDFDASIEGESRDIGRNGSYLVIRQLEQHVDRFWAYCDAAAKDIQVNQKPGYPVDGTYVAAKMVGRWKDGSPLVRWPYQSETEYRLGNGDTDPERLKKGAPPPAPPHIKPANDFRFGTEDPQAIRCPFGAHIRRTNPRESQLPGEDEQIDISNRHRILRIGRQYAPSKGQDPGILFMCLNGDIERQFEFIQQTWANSGHFHGLDGESDPLITADGKEGHFTIPTRNGPIRLEAIPNFVTTRGGGYFFLAGRKLIEFLALP
jgi:Dyp-type peroxidase family